MSVRWGQADVLSKAGTDFSKVHYLIKVWGYWTDGSEALSQSLTEVSAQSGWTVVHSELDEGVQEVSVQVGELLAGADLLQVVGGDNEEVTKGVECVEELQHQRDLEDIWTHRILYTLHLQLDTQNYFPQTYTRMSWQVFNIPDYSKVWPDCQLFKHQTIFSIFKSSLGLLSQVVLRSLMSYCRTDRRQNVDLKAVKYLQLLDENL